MFSFFSPNQSLRTLITFSLVLLYAGVTAQGLPPLQDRWKIQADGSILWEAAGNTPYTDHIEMSGSRASLWVQYGVDTAGHLQLRRTVVFPSFRMQPNDTHGSLMYTFDDGNLPRFFIEGRPLHADIISGIFYTDADDRVRTIRHNGIMRVSSGLTVKKGKQSYGVGITRDLFPSVDKPMAIERMVFRNEGTVPVHVGMENMSRVIRTDSASSYPSSHFVIQSAEGAGTVLLQPGDSVDFGIVYRASDSPMPSRVEVGVSEASAKAMSAGGMDIGGMGTGVVGAGVVGIEEARRADRISSFGRNLQLETPDTILNTAFAFAKRRIGESVYETKAGPMMCPGGLRYYAAIWANDEAEYANPFYPFTGDSLGNAAAVNTYNMFARYMNSGYKPIPSSIVAEGESYWAGAGDRGDAAMIAYGAARFALAYGNQDTARKLWPLIQWCLEFSRRKKNEGGVIASDHDELEGRFPAGKANLNTSCLYYDALVSSVELGRVLGLPEGQCKGYAREADSMRKAIERYFGADMKGFATYRYYKENTLLRSWICVPLVMGIYERAKSTVEALFSPALFTSQGFLTQEGNNTFWDRSTLYALRGIFAAGEPDRALSFLRYYSEKRLLGDHVPYPVEAYPEGGQRHLAAESALYCRIFTEGMFGIRPVGFRAFQCSPRMPAGWDSMALRGVRAFGSDFDIIVKRKKGRLRVMVRMYTDNAAADAGRNAPDAGRNTADAGRNAAGAGKNAPGAGRNAAETDINVAGAGRNAVGTDINATGADMNAAGAGRNAVGRDIHAERAGMRDAKAEAHVTGKVKVYEVREGGTVKVEL